MMQHAGVDSNPIHSHIFLRPGVGLAYDVTSSIL